jgi:hypothetical protein
MKYCWLKTRKEETSTIWQPKEKMKILEEMWGFAREARGNPKEITKKLLLVKDKTGNSSWQRIAKGGSLEALEKLWNWAKEVQINTHELLLNKEKHEKIPCNL